MLHPISFNVIRQALSWANLYPFQCRQLLSHEGQDGSQNALYQLSFDFDELTDLRDQDNPYPPISHSEWLRETAELCFCSDVKIGTSWCNDKRDTVYLQLFVSLTPEQVVSEGELSWLLD